MIKINSGVIYSIKRRNSFILFRILTVLLLLLSGCLLPYYRELHRHKGPPRAIEFKSPLVTKHKIYVSLYAYSAGFSLAIRTSDKISWKMEHPTDNSGFNRMIEGENIHLNEQNIDEFFRLYCKTVLPPNRMGRLIDSLEQFLSDPSIIISYKYEECNSPDSSTLAKISPPEYFLEGEDWKFLFYTYEDVGTGNVNRWTLIVNKFGIVKDAKKEILEENVGAHPEDVFEGLIY